MNDRDLWVRPGNWKRFICNWRGHENIGTRDLLYGTPEVMCLRCRGSASTRPSPAVLPQPETEE